ncbi:MAG TPA: hypothetical protein VNM69_06965 [Bacillus sp. (in: firmicutes)]|uniref:hypothetical protein n=1 Tax=Bacillus litorisediminis TaxID=2922713 RepID=UPI001FAD0168|nr:hypothetical protein [Bacillus litorisediminis]HWO75649.1 hypothetical protein [Bacillus sp. (in: firmicutes)]
MVYGINSESVYAISNDKPRPLEEIYPEIGYKTVEEAVKEFEQHFKHDLKLPLRVPPLTFTHYFGRFNDLGGDMNDYIECVFINENSAEHHYKIDVRHITNKIPIRDKYVKNVFKLNNGTNATYMKISGFNVLVFETDNWQYMLSIDKIVSDKVTP